MSFAFRHFGLLGLGAIGLIFILPALQLDQALIAPYYSTTMHQFSLKHDAFLSEIMHEGLKYLMISIAILSAALSLYTRFLSTKFKAESTPLAWAFAGMLLSVLVVNVFKRLSIHACPWDLTLYGGHLPYLDLFSALPAGVEAGRCLPGAHASGGFALMAFYFAFKHSRPLFAQTMLILGLVFGFAMGWAQMMRGAHFLSHNLWSCWWVYGTLVVLNLLWPTQKNVNNNF